MGRRNVLNKLPNEFCKRLVAYLPNQSLSALCIVSKAAYKFFSPNLYSRKPTVPQTTKFLLTLANPKRVGFGEHPATHIRHLDLAISVLADYTSSPDQQKKREEQIQQYSKLVITAIDNTARVSSGRSGLQAISWTSNVALEELGPLLINSSRFPDLKAVKVCSISSYGKNSKRANFQVRCDTIYSFVSF